MTDQSSAITPPPELVQPDQDDKTLNAIRETTPRYRMSVIVSTTDSAIDTRINVIWQALDLSKEILESVSLPEQLPPLGNQYRRPQPLSLKEQALEQLRKVNAMLQFQTTGGETSAIRRALEQLNDE